MWNELFISIGITLVAGELLGGFDCLAKRIVQASARAIGGELGKRLEEEWRAHLADMPTRLARLWIAVGCVWAAHVTMHERILPGVSPWVAVKLRLLDLIVSFFVLCSLWPFMVILILALKTEHGWGKSAFVQSRRIGRGGKIFHAFQFRTFVRVQERGQNGRPSNCLETAFVGRLIRRTGLNFLPLLLNVVKGDMSLVGPHAVSPGAEAELTIQVPGYGARRCVKPGVVGLGMLRVPRPTTREEFQAQLHADLSFVRQMYSPRGYILMLWKAFILEGFH